MRRFASTFAALLFGCIAYAVPALAEWQPSGPIKMMIAFRAGGGADTQARLIAEELEVRKGWKIIPENVTGKGGANMANALKKEPGDGLSIGMAVIETFVYNTLANPKIGYSTKDFTYITTTAPTQMGIVARADKGWKSLDDLVAAAKAGQKVSVSAMSPRLADGVYMISQHYGIDLNTVMVKGGKGSMNAIMAGDVDAGWVAGIQAKGVKSGDLVNLASGEGERLAMSPDAATLSELGMPFAFGATFAFVGPAGMPADARKTIAAAVAEILNDSETKAAKMISKAFGPPLVLSGGDFDNMVERAIEQDQALLKATE